jgi:hypothetical protein
LQTEKTIKENPYKNKWKRRKTLRYSQALRAVIWQRKSALTWVVNWAICP